MFKQKMCYTWVMDTPNLASTRDQGGNQAFGEHYLFDVDSPSPNPILSQFSPPTSDQKKSRNYNLFKRSPVKSGLILSRSARAGTQCVCAGERWDYVPRLSITVRLHFRVRILVVESM